MKRRTLQILSSSALLGASAVFAMSSAACGPSLMRGARDEPESASDAMAGACGDEADIWLVDVGQDNLQQDIQESITERKPLLVKFSCDKREVKVLRGCSIASGRYKYQGYEFTQKAKELNDADEMGTSLSGGPVIAAKFKAEFERGSIFQIDYARAGAFNLTLDYMDKSQITGPDRCQEATHFVFGADLGAYAMNSGARATLDAAAEVFGQGLHAASKSDAKNAARGGESARCKGAAMGDGSPLDGCAVPIVLHLRPIDPVPATAHASTGEHGYSTHTCPVGKAPNASGTCVAKGGKVSYQCNPTDLGECRTQCSGGNPQSCVILGNAYENEEGVGKDLGAAKGFYERACKAGEARGCAGVGMVLSKQKDPDAKSILEKACAAGAMRGCSGLGQILRKSGQKESAARMFIRACEGGYRRGCFYAGMMLADLKKSLDDAAEYYLMACAGDDERGCLSYGDMRVDLGKTKQEKDKGKQYLDKGLASLVKECDGESNYLSCASIGDYYLGRFTGRTNQKDKARPYLEKACNKGHDEGACGDLRDLGGATTTTKKKPFKL